MPAHHETHTLPEWQTEIERAITAHAEVIMQLRAVIAQQQQQIETLTTPQPQRRHPFGFTSQAR